MMNSNRSSLIAVEIEAVVVAKEGTQREDEASRDIRRADTERVEAREMPGISMAAKARRVVRLGDRNLEPAAHRVARKIRHAAVARPARLRSHERVIHVVVRRHSHVAVVRLDHLRLLAVVVRLESPSVVDRRDRLRLLLVEVAHRRLDAMEVPRVSPAASVALNREVRDAAQDQVVIPEVTGRMVRHRDRAVAAWEPEMTETDVMARRVVPVQTVMVEAQVVTVMAARETVGRAAHRPALVDHAARSVMVIEETARKVMADADQVVLKAEARKARPQVAVVVRTTVQDAVARNDLSQKQPEVLLY